MKTAETPQLIWVLLQAAGPGRDGAQNGTRQWDPRPPIAAAVTIGRIGAAADPDGETAFSTFGFQSAPSQLKSQDLI